jgi:uncharacterized protein DUF2804
MPLRSHGQTRKVWRYVGVYGPEVMLCAAQARIGPFEQSFWAVWDRERRERFAHTRNLPWGSQVRLDGPRVELDAGEVRAELELGAAQPIEAICPSGEGWGWTRKRAGVPVSGTIEAAGRSWQIDGALAVDDESAGYHQRHTSWYWSAGIGEAADGRPLGWNLVTGINDPPRGSERAIWIDGEPHEPDPVRFDGLESIEFADGERLAFASESERARNENFLVFRSRYRHRFGTFAGALGGIELGQGFGVMEEHEAVW